MTRVAMVLGDDFSYEKCKNKKDIILNKKNEPNIRSAINTVVFETDCLESQQRAHEIEIYTRGNDTLELQIDDDFADIVL